MHWLIRFWLKVEFTDTCWNWTAALNPDGYGSFRTPKGTTLPHRISYELLVGPVPRKLELDHLCRNRRCLNPSHLEPVTHRVNFLRSPMQFGGRHGALTCQRGHNDWVQHPSNSGRKCRACRQERDRRYYNDKKTSALRR